jgi:hypothetical protein
LFISPENISFSARNFPAYARVHAHISEFTLREFVEERTRETLYVYLPNFFAAASERAPQVRGYVLLNFVLRHP